MGTCISVRLTGGRATRCELGGVGADGRPTGATTGDSQLRQELAEVQEYGERLNALEARLGTVAVPTPPVQQAQDAAPQPTVDVPPGPLAQAVRRGRYRFTAQRRRPPRFQPRYSCHRKFSWRCWKEHGRSESRAGDARIRGLLPGDRRSIRSRGLFHGVRGKGVDLEEGFITFPAIPGGLLVKVGKMRAAFGKVNALHSHAIPWTDRPLVINNLTGGEEGIADAGVSAARLISNP